MTSSPPPTTSPASEPPATLGRDLIAGVRAAIVPLAISGVVLVAAVLAIGFGLVGRHGGGAVQGFDTTISHDSFNHRVTGLVDVAKVLNQVGSVGGLAIITVLLGVVLWLRGHRLRAAVPFVAFVGGEVIVYAAKAAIARPRPALRLQAMHETDYSFPSGHSTATAAVVLSLAVLFVHSRARRPSWPLVLAVVAGVTMAASRLVLDVHWFSDVTTGLVAGSLWGVVTGTYLLDRSTTDQVET